MKLYFVDTISTHRMSYVIRCKNEEHAADAVVCDDPKEFSQEWLGENVVRVREIHEDDYIEIFDKENDYLKNWDVEQKKSLVTQVNYDKEEPGHDFMSRAGDL